MDRPGWAALFAMCAIAQHFGRPGTPTDQAWIESLNGHRRIGLIPHRNLGRKHRNLGAQRALRRQLCHPKTAQGEVAVRRHGLAAIIRSSRQDQADTPINGDRTGVVVDVGGAGARVGDVCVPRSCRPLVAMAPSLMWTTSTISLTLATSLRSCLKQAVTDR